MRRVQVLEAGEVAADDDQVHAPLVLDVEVAHGRAVASTMRKRSALRRGRGAARACSTTSRSPPSRDREAVRTSAAPAVAGRSGVAAVRAARHRLAASPRSASGSSARADGRGGAEDRASERRRTATRREATLIARPRSRPRRRRARRRRRPSAVAGDGEAPAREIDVDGVDAGGSATSSERRRRSGQHGAAGDGVRGSRVERDSKGGRGGGTTRT